MPYLIIRFFDRYKFDWQYYFITWYAKVSDKGILSFLGVQSSSRDSITKKEPQCVTLLRSKISVHGWMSLSHQSSSQSGRYTKTLSQLISADRLLLLCLSLRISLLLTENWLTLRLNKKLVNAFQFEVKVKPSALETTVSTPLKGVKNIIAVTSAKGGWVNQRLQLTLRWLCLNLVQKSVCWMCGHLRPIGSYDARQLCEARSANNKGWCQSKHTAFTHSIGYLVSKDDAAIWRGPMAAKALGQLVNETVWPELDYSGYRYATGHRWYPVNSIPANPSNRCAVVVTTPQDLALADARKGVAMFDKVSVPVAGLAETLSHHHICSHCGEKEHIFGAGGAEAMSEEFYLDI